ncbi:hypothetical protein CY34DRAFT_102180 [Suillus luteus UH-Slu-Lm8-n1]|uniref:Uncharacterized protein n=1 Tax=Suillus luteus UH-Slu-Lm8-n1 TaxID=930992 RepID=A0A0C9Z418_9AGAM|nr:hypothetical protein CY34DRAFT_102180 [Suillus luteus UH-Slu-Lm8-n1]
MYGLYLASVGEVRLEAYAMGWSAVTTLPDDNVEVCFCARMAPYPSLHPSVVTTKGVPSNRGPLRTGSDVRIFLSAMNASVCRCPQY